MLIVLEDFDEFRQFSHHLNSKESQELFLTLMKIRNLGNRHEIYKTCVVMLCENESEFNKMVTKEFILFLFENKYEIDFLIEFKEVIIEDDKILELFLDISDSNFLGEILLEKFQSSDELPRHIIMTKSLNSTQGFHKEQIFQLICSKLPQELKKIISVFQNSGIAKEEYFAEEGLKMFKLMIWESLENEINREELKWLFNSLKVNYFERLCTIIETVYESSKMLYFKQSSYSPQNLNNTYFIFSLVQQLKTFRKYY
jgi:hypothetical protein